MSMLTIEQRLEFVRLANSEALAAQAQENENGDCVLCARHYLRAVEYVISAINNFPFASSASKTYFLFQCRQKVFEYVQRLQMMAEVAKDEGLNLDENPLLKQVFASQQQPPSGGGGYGGQGEVSAAYPPPLGYPTMGAMAPPVQPMGVPVLGTPFPMSYYMPPPPPPPPAAMPEGPQQAAPAGYAPATVAAHPANNNNNNNSDFVYNNNFQNIPAPPQSVVAMMKEDTDEDLGWDFGGPSSAAVGGAGTQKQQQPTAAEVSHFHNDDDEVDEDFEAKLREMGKRQDDK